MADRCRDPNLKEKLAAMIVAHFGIPHEVAKTMPVARILSMVAWDHYPVPMTIALDTGWTPEQVNHPSNLQPLIHEDHGIKTAKRDIPEIRKADRISEAHERFRRALLAKSGQVSGVRSDEKPKRRWPPGKIPSRPFPTKRRNP